MLYDYQLENHLAIVCFLDESVSAEAYSETLITSFLGKSF
jgi:hypothetical protein